MRLSTAGAVVTACGVLAACGGTDETRPTYELPGARVFPEGIGLDRASGDFYVGSSRDGTVYRGNVRRERLEAFLPGGRDGRTAATGIRVEGGRLWVAGRFTGRLFVYDLRTRRLLRRLQAPDVGQTSSPRRERSLVNDLAFAGGAAYVTDSFQPVVYRVRTAGGRIGELEPWLDLRGTPAVYRRGFNLNGIAASADGRHLVTVNTDSGDLFRIDVRTRAVRRIDIGGARLRTGDGLSLRGTTLLVVREQPGELTPVRLSPDLLRGEVGRPFGREQLRFPTTMAALDGRALVVNSQFDAGDSPTLPFTVSSVPIPPGATASSAVTSSAAATSSQLKRSSAANGRIADRAGRDSRPRTRPG